MSARGLVSSPSLLGEEDHRAAMVEGMVPNVAHIPSTALCAVPLPVPGRRRNLFGRVAA